MKTTQSKSKISGREVLWLVVTAAAAILTIHSTYKHGIEKSWMMLLTTVVAFLMFFIRRNIRKNRDAEND